LAQAGLQIDSGIVILRSAHFAFTMQRHQTKHGRYLFCLCLAFFFLKPSPTQAWGCKGHQTIAFIAEKYLTPEARQLVDKLLTENLVDPLLKRYCGNPTRDLMADASTWADDVRNERKNGQWHYIDIPRGALHGPLDFYCGDQGCITKAIADQVAILKDKSADPHKRADALRYIIHFVGDLHMPLHASTNDDEGGNCVPVRYFRRQPHENHNSFAPNLHAVWDTAIPERDMEGAEPPEYADHLIELFSSNVSKWQAEGIHVGEWAWQSHDLAETVAYGKLDPTVPVETPTPVHSCTDDNNIGERMLHLHLVVGENYQEAADLIVEQQLAEAGIRLAMILNDVTSTAKL
jgi:nuclease S1